MFEIFIERLALHQSTIEQMLTQHRDRYDDVVQSDVIIDRELDHSQLANIVLGFLKLHLTEFALC